MTRENRDVIVKKEGAARGISFLKGQAAGEMLELKRTTEDFAGNASYWMYGFHNEFDSLREERFEEGYYEGLRPSGTELAVRLVRVSRKMHMDVPDSLLPQDVQEEILRFERKYGPLSDADLEKKITRESEYLVQLISFLSA